ncbi:MAG: hypothetical protein IGS38_00150 [Synechococcales cyanobacterium M58_A2018_015]|nr:hypothetical protein [Synechococcales cyanobacterium M58_A2018_015]
MKSLTPSSNRILDPLQQTLDQLAAELENRKDEVVELLSNEQPSKSRQVELTYAQCIWWEGCYYCKDHTHHWHRIKCFV